MIQATTKETTPMSASPKQIAYIESLLMRKHNTRHVTSAIRSLYHISQRCASGHWTKAEASHFIDQLTA